MSRNESKDEFQSLYAEKDTTDIMNSYYEVRKVLVLVINKEEHDF